MPDPDVLVFQPRRHAAPVAGAFWFAMALVIGWLGLILDQSAVDAMDGLPLLLFTAIPIPILTWGMVPVLVGLGIATFVDLRVPQSRLTLDRSGITRRSVTVAWSEVVGVRALKGDQVAIDVKSNRDVIARYAWWRRLEAVIRARLYGTPFTVSADQTGVPAAELLEVLELRLASAATT